MAAATTAKDALSVELASRHAAGSSPHQAAPPPPPPSSRLLLLDEEDADAYVPSVLKPRRRTAKQALPSALHLAVTASAGVATFAAIEAGVVMGLGRQNHMTTYIMQGAMVRRGGRGEGEDVGEVSVAAGAGVGRASSFGIIITRAMHHKRHTKINNNDTT
jgi:hypothetical protein